MNRNKLKSVIKQTPLGPPAQVLLKKSRLLGKKTGNIPYYLDKREYQNVNKVVYAITPPARLDNIGDHAQVIGIKKWLNEYFNPYHVLEVDKDETTHFIPAVKRITNDNDLVFLHSGGNLNDRSLWSEGARRKVVTNFPRNTIVQLPQTIFFSDTSRGRKECKKSKQIYESHDNLVITARDPVSLEKANNYFDVETLIAPDFALMIDASEFVDLDIQRSGAMLCLRRDEESDLSDEDKSTLESYLGDTNMDITRFDTTLDQPIEKNKRETHLQNTLQRFVENELVITDRFHGMIFSVITQTPCVAIDTVDHKISSSSTWFDELDAVTYTSEMSEIPALIDELRHKSVTKINMQSKYFEPFAEEVMNNMK